MKFWIDAQLPPQTARWLSTSFGVSASTLDELGLRLADDLEIFRSLGRPGDVVITKDEDFLDLIARFGPPPQVVWVT